jgi:hypothetical protein
MSLAEVKTEVAGGEVPPTKPIAMPHNCLDGFNLGADLDLRVRFAMELLKSPIFQGRALVSKGDQANSDTIHVVTNDPQYQGSATLALDIAEELFAVAQERGLIKEITGDSIDDHLKAHVRRQVDFNLYQQSEAQRQSEARVKLASAVASTLRKQ